MEESLAVLARLGIRPQEDPAVSRKLVIPSTRPGLSFLTVRGWDVPTYVEQGAADLGIVGLDVLEEQRQDLHRALDLGIGACRMSVAEPREMARGDDPDEWSRVRVATKYPVITAGYFRRKGIQVEIVRLSGSIELAPLTGLAGRIVDLVSTGRTLAENGLKEVAVIMHSTAWLVVNRSSLVLHHGVISGIIRDLAALDEERRTT
jgi:ATP phosphoribosyltransferase